MKAYYAARAPYYDAVYLKPERRKDITFLAEHIPQRLRGREIIEIACGTGYWTQHIAPAVSRMVAIDLTAEPLEFARLRPGTDKVRFRQLDAYALPSSLGRFNGAFAGLWFSHVPISARKAFLTALHSLLDPGSRVLFLDNSHVQLRDFPIAETDDEGNTYQLRQLRDGSTHRVLKNFPTEAELRKLLAGSCGQATFRELQNFWLLEYELL
jgi:demethylmenaquinone methyltransferase/2-methoxy-6-polyprenyl-1,4-benzoquinol methylase